MQPQQVISPNNQPQTAQPKQQPVEPAQQQPQAVDSDTGLVNWSASEFVAYKKTAGWYFMILLGLVGISGLIYVLTGDVISTVSTILIGALFLGFASRQPRVLNYQISTKGITVGDRNYAFNTIKSFAVIDEGNLHSIMLIPVQRFMPSVSIYFDPQDEDHIVETLGDFLPHEDRKQDPIDRLMHRIRF